MGEASEENIRESFFNDISVLAFLKPLIDDRKIILFTTPELCVYCLAKKSSVKMLIDASSEN